MSWFSKYVGDPLKALLAKAETAGVAELKALAGDVATTLPAAPISATAETDFVSAIQTAMDGGITAAVGEIPAVGAVLAPEAVAEANAAIAYLVQKGVDALSALAAEAKANLARIAAGGAASGQAAKPAAQAAPNPNPTAAEMAGA